VFIVIAAAAAAAAAVVVDVIFDHRGEGSPNHYSRPQHHHQ